MPALTPGSSLPDLALPTDGGGTVTLSALKGRKLVLFFYPKADTSGCTIEAKHFSRLKAEFAAADTEVFGISADPVKAQDKFKKKQELTVPLVSDTEKALIEPLGLWVEKSMYGRKYMGIERTTLLVDRDGRIAKIWPKVSIDGHAEEVLEAARAL